MMVIGPAAHIWVNPYGCVYANVHCYLRGVITIQSNYTAVASRVHSYAPFPCHSVDAECVPQVRFDLRCFVGIAVRLFLT